MTEFKVDRAVVYGRGVWATFMMYLLRATGMGGRDGREVSLFYQLQTGSEVVAARWRRDDEKDILDRLSGW
jgi:hypothetical protein